MGFFNVQPSIYNDPLAGYAHEVANEMERRRLEDAKIDAEAAERKIQEKKKHEKEVIDTIVYEDQLKRTAAIEVAEKEFEQARQAEEKSYKRSEEGKRLKEQEARRKRFDSLARGVADDYNKGLAKGGVKEACMICLEYIRFRKSADVTEEEFKEALSKVLAYAYQNCSDDTMVEEYHCDENCIDTDFPKYCKGALLLESKTGKKCPFARYDK